MLNQFAVEILTLPVDQCHSHLIRYLGGMLRHSFVSPSRREGPPSIRDTHGTSGNVFTDPFASSSAPYPQELHQWSSSSEEPLHSSAVEKSERQEQDHDLRCHSGPSAKNSVIFSGGDYSKNYGADQQRLQISDLHFDKFPTPATFACWKIRFKSEVCTCSQFPTETMQWIKQVELVDSVDELRSSSSVRGIRMPNFEVLDARIASALNKIIHNSHLKRRISLEEQKGPEAGQFFLCGREAEYTEFVLKGGGSGGRGLQRMGVRVWVQRTLRTRHECHGVIAAAQEKRVRGGSDTSLESRGAGSATQRNTAPPLRPLPNTTKGLS